MLKHTANLLLTKGQRHRIPDAINTRFPKTKLKKKVDKEKKYVYIYKNIQNHEVCTKRRLNQVTEVISGDVTPKDKTKMSSPLANEILCCIFLTCSWDVSFLLAASDQTLIWSNWNLKDFLKGLEAVLPTTFL